MPEGSPDAALSTDHDSRVSPTHLANDTYRSLVERSLSGVLVHRNHRVLYANDAWARIYGMSREEAMQLDSVDELIHSDDRKRVVDYFYQRQRGEAVPEIYDYRITRRDGEIRTLQMQAFLVDWNGEVACCATVIDVTLERARAQASIVEYEQAEREITLISQAVRQSSDGLVICDAKQPGNPVIFANPAFKGMSGYPDTELIGRSCKMLQGPDTDVETLAEIRRCISEGVEFSGRILNYRKGGLPFWNRLSISPVRDENGELTHFVGTQRDITDQVELNEEILLSRRALDQAYDRIGVVDLDHRYIYVNEALCQRFGKTREQLIGTSIPELVGEELFQQKIAPLLLRATAGELVRDYAAMPNTQGEISMIEYSAAPHYSDDDEVVGVSLVSRDRTEESKTREALAESELRFRDFASLGADIFFEASIDGKLSWMSDGMIEWLQSNQPTGSQASLRTILMGGISPEDAAQLLQSIDAGQPFHVEHQVRTETDTIRVMEFRGHAYDCSSGVRCYRGIGRDLTDQRRAEIQLEWQATHDEMTGLINRREFGRSIRERLASEGDAQSHSLMFLDLDHLKIVNDTCGHAAGDRLLQQLTEYLRKQVRVGTPILARVGGDEFALLVSGLSEQATEDLAHEIVKQANHVQLRLAGRIFAISLSIGVVHLTGSERSLEESLACADVACYQAKRLGRNQVAIYRDDDERLLRQRRVNRMEAEIREALEHDRFELYLQPIVSLATPQPTIVKYEVLVRMRSVGGALIMPNDFIDSAEAYGLITDIDRWVTGSAIRLINSMPSDIALSINLSGKSFADPDLAHEIGRELHKHAIEGSRLCFEITETAAIRRRDSAIALIKTLRNYGCRVSLDDFGSGLSSFRYLKDFDIDEIKIDGAFITDLNNSPDDQVLVSAIVDIARSFGMDLVAEMVENEKTFDTLRDMNVGYAQGYFFGKPTLAADVLASLNQQPTIVEMRKLA